MVASKGKMIRRTICGDCGVEEGRLHILGCDMEVCPFCGVDEPFLLVRIG
jgi:hypothetical protein